MGIFTAGISTTGISTTGTPAAAFSISGFYKRKSKKLVVVSQFAGLHILGKKIGIGYRYIFCFIF